MLEGKKNAVPTTLQLKLPVDMGSTFITAFVEKFKSSCAEFGAHDVDAGSMWYYFRPAQSGCRLAAADVNTYTASVAPSPQQTTGKFPEYNKIWEDGKFNTVAIFGKYEDGATSGSDAGIAAWNEFYKGAKAALGAYGTVTTVPATIPTNPGTAITDIEMSVTRADGKKINLTMLLSDNVRTGLQNPAFRTRYENASTRADLHHLQWPRWAWRQHSRIVASWQMGNWAVCDFVRKRLRYLRIHRRRNAQSSPSGECR